MFNIGYILLPIIIKKLLLKCNSLATQDIKENDKKCRQETEKKSYGNFTVRTHINLVVVAVPPLQNYSFATRF